MSNHLVLRSIKRPQSHSSTPKKQHAASGVSRPPFIHSLDVPRINTIQDNLYAQSFSSRSSSPSCHPSSFHDLASGSPKEFTREWSNVLRDIAIISTDQVVDPVSIMDQSQPIFFHIANFIAQATQSPILVVESSSRALSKKIVSFVLQNFGSNNILMGSSEESPISRVVNEAVEASNKDLSHKILTLSQQVTSLQLVVQDISSKSLHLNFSTSPFNPNPPPKSSGAVTHTTNQAPTSYASAAKSSLTKPSTKKSGPSCTNDPSAYIEKRILDGKESTPDKAADLAGYNNYQLRKDQAIALLELTVENEQRIHFIAELSKEQPSAMWTALENAHRQKKPAQRFNAYEKLFSMQKTDDESLTQFAGRIKASLIDIQALRDSGFTLESLDDELASMALLKGLSTEKYSNLRTSLLITTKLSMSDLVQALALEQANTNQSASDLAQRAFVKPISAKASKASKQCTFYGRNGHELSRCFDMKNASKKRKDELKNNKGKGKQEEAKAVEDATVEFAGNASTSDFTNPYSPLLLSASADWITNTGATCHMTPHRHWFAIYTPQRIPVKLANDTTIYSVEIGSVKFQAISPHFSPPQRPTTPQTPLTPLQLPSTPAPPIRQLPLRKSTRAKTTPVPFWDVQQQIGHRQNLRSREHTPQPLPESPQDEQASDEQDAEFAETESNRLSEAEIAQLIYTGVEDFALSTAL
ncbi:hypothetical protein PNOK_0117100 [Pyrrhoderma noxium]|uniref:Retrovirus-related Pol polyprotein from transposon TNT 1-94-like beta-barrel domain-containing protein n=1 Tax=Pyrrhoderma noxium TaxID=2282107 RepID=A0A286UWX6_9AGAM|nr:hypothetical protein PNOK_0117100 [Pyrrhoderma noxium]